MTRDSSDNFEVVRLDSKEGLDDLIAVPSERVITIYVNSVEIVTLLASPTNLEELAAGFLFSEGFVRDPESINKIELDGDGYVWVEGQIESPPKSKRKILTSGCGKGLTFQHALEELSPIESNIEIEAQALTGLFHQMQERSDLYRRSGGLHSAALCDEKRVLISAEDIGRHNAVDKVLGEAFLNSVHLRDKILITSGRISSEMAGKAISARIPVIASRTSPTDASVELAKCYDLTLVGYVRAKKMTVYSKAERIVAG